MEIRRDGWFKRCECHRRSPFWNRPPAAAPAGRRPMLEIEKERDETLTCLSIPPLRRKGGNGHNATTPQPAATSRNQPQPAATSRNQPQPAATSRNQPIHSA